MFGLLHHFIKQEILNIPGFFIIKIKHVGADPAYAGQAANMSSRIWVHLDIQKNKLYFVSMLISTMNPKEVRNEFMRDLNKLKETTVPRLWNEYHRERKNFRIDPGKEYMKVWTIKTRAKNNWLIFVRKSPSVVKYKNTEDLAYCCITYYYDREGLCVIRQFEELDMIEAFWGHLFTRYKERMHLEVSSTIELIKHFFNHSGYIHHLIYSTALGKRNIGICKEGFVFGEVQNEGTWLVNKTFVSKDLAFDMQNQLEAQMIQLLQQDTLRDLASPNFNEIEYERKNNMLLSLRA